MKVNWKDIGLAYVAWIILVFFLIGDLADLAPSVPSILLTLLAFAMPLAFYFIRNSLPLADAALISFAFGVTSMLLFAIIGSIGTTPVLSTGVVDPFSLLASLMLFGLVSLLCGLVVWFVVSRLKPAKMHQE